MNISLTDGQKCCKKLHAMTLALNHLGSVYETTAAGQTDCILLSVQSIAMQLNITVLHLTTNHLSFWSTSVCHSKLFHEMQDS
jgi:hypothetical protein